jgi:hypothetical protein
VYSSWYLKFKLLLKLLTHRLAQIVIIDTYLGGVSAPAVVFVFGVMCTPIDHNAIP